MTQLTGHEFWQILSHTGYLIISIVGSLIVLGVVYYNRRKQKGKH